MALMLEKGNLVALFDAIEEQVFSRVLNKLYVSEWIFQVQRCLWVFNQVFSTVVTPTGPLDCPTGVNATLTSGWDNKAVRARLRIRLMNERAVLCCLKCRAIRNLSRTLLNQSPHACISCQGLMLVCAREDLKKCSKDGLLQKKRAIEIA